MSGGNGDSPLSVLARPRALGLFLASAAVNALLLWRFHDQYWFPVDEGIYAHLAERVLDGEVLSLHVQDLHPGYVTLLNAAAFRAFGVDLVSLRYPLALSAFAQACLVYLLLARRDVFVAAAGSVAVVAIGVIQFLDPSANWYCLFLAVVLVCWLTWVPGAHPSRLIGAGLLAGTIALFRQLTGVWVAMAVVALALWEHSSDARGRQTLVARLVLLAMLMLVLAYLIFSPEPQAGGIALTASWPIGILGWLLLLVRTHNHAAAVILMRFGTGALAAALPLVLFHLAHGSLGAWLGDTVSAAAGLSQLAFFGEAAHGGWFALLPIAALYQMISSFDAAGILNGFYWTVLPLLAAANGLLTIAHLRRPHDVRDLTLPIVAAFYAMVSLYMEGAIYLYYAVGLTVTAVLWMTAIGPRWQRTACAAAAIVVSIVGVVWHAGQSHLRTSLEMLEGRRVATTGGGMFDRCSLRLDPILSDPYRRLVQIIQAEVPPGGPIFALPSDSELYFLANRPNPFRFYNTALGVRSPQDLSQVIDRLQNHPPRVVTFRPGDKYNTSASHEIMTRVRSLYDRIDTVDGVEVYRLRDRQAIREPG